MSYFIRAQDGRFFRGWGLGGGWSRDLAGAQPYTSYRAAAFARDGWRTWQPVPDGLLVGAEVVPLTAALLQAPQPGFSLGVADPVVVARAG